MKRHSKMPWRASCLTLALALCLALAGCGKGAGGSAAQPREAGPPLVAGALEDAIQIGGAGLAEGGEVTLMVDITLTGPTAHLSIGPKKPAGMRMQAVADGKGQELGAAPDAAGVIDEYGQLAGDYYAQLAVADLDGDGTYELLASIGNGTDSLRTLVYRYQSGAAQPFAAVGAIDGAAQITVETGGVLLVPGGAQGAEQRLRLEGDALVLAQDRQDEMG